MAPERSPPITVCQVTKAYGAMRALDEVDLAVRSGEFLTLLGPSGSGKTTLLMVLAGFVRPDHGSIRFGDDEVVRAPPHKRDVGMVFQNYALFPHMNVAGNIANHLTSFASKTHQKSGSFPPPALPGFSGTMTLSDSRTDRHPGLRRGRLFAAPLRPLPSPCTGLPRLRVTCLDVLRPLPRWTSPGASVGCFPKPCCLPRSPAGSASMTSLSRPAQALHTLRPVDSLNRQRRPLSQGFGPAGYPTKPPACYRANRPLPGWDFHPRGVRAVRGATVTTEQKRPASTEEATPRGDGGRPPGAAR